MNYYLLCLKKGLPHAPSLKLDYIKFKSSGISLRTANTIPQLQMIQIQPDRKVKFYSVVEATFLCVDAATKDILLDHEEWIVYKKIILMDAVNFTSQPYFMMIPEEVNCIQIKSPKDRELEQSVFDFEKLAGRGFIKVAGLTRQAYIVNEEVKERLEKSTDCISFHKIKGN